ncbi:HD-GYP domain-containing protein [Reinekea blandensis]|uniref:HD-GYP domain n=1 Tax=Reinekea blandensis MED297 TaxID=314283 RepID=A4BDB2_9GAMM|nr:HD-GYP domain-containing protein [Reinekea blandensis]EAR09856.1 HD-GYP domain [Reinekea sp. MED297] [Reinekea blandensis MED297]
MTHDQNPDSEIWENQQKIDSQQIRIGHYVARLSLHWEKTPFLLQGFLIADESEVNWIRRHCDWAVIDLQKSRANARPGATPRQVTSPNLLAKPAVLSRSPLTAASMRTSLTNYLNLSAEAERLIQHFDRLESINVRKTIHVVKDIALTLTANLPALVWLTRIKHEDRYTAEHCINVSLLAMGLANALGRSPKEVAQVGIAGLLHDLGKIDIDASILNKTGRLTPEEYEHMKQHSQFGYDRLRQEPDMSPRILEAILGHHERPDGHGYPRGLVGDQIDEMASIVGLVDAYDAITSNRVYQQARSHHEAMSILWRMRGTQFDKTLVEAFIQFMGWVTPGTLVSLSTGDLAVVVQAVEGQRLYPKVRILMPTSEGYHLGATWDLSTMAQIEGQEPVTIRDVKPDGYLGIRLEDYAASLLQS